MFIFDKAPFPSCHASTVVETAPGKFLAAWFGGKAEKAKDVQIWLSRYDGKDWSPLEVVGTEPGQPTWNPVLFQTKKGTLRLWYKGGPDPMSWTGYVRTSTDGGKSWDKPTMLPAGFYGPVRAKPIELADGTILAGTSLESHRCWTPYVDRSTDEGKTWLRSTPFNTATGHHQIQPTLFVGSAGQIVALTRSSDPRFVCRSESTDGGKTFTPSVPTSVPNPSAGIDAVRMPTGEVYLLCNPTPILRTPLSIMKSTDDGKSWTKAYDVETEVGEFSYPAMILTSDGKLAMTYTWKRTHIKFVVVDPGKF